MMGDATGNRAPGVLAREWPYLLCTVAVVVLVAASVRNSTESGECARPVAAREAPADFLREKVLAEPGPMIVFGFAVLAAVLCSYVWLIGRRVRRARVFPDVRPAAARWNEWDAVKVLVVYVLVSMCMPNLGIGAGDDRVAVDNAAKLIVLLVAFRVIRERGQRPVEALGLGASGLGRVLVPGLFVFFALLPLLVGMQQWWVRWLERFEGEVEVTQDIVATLVTSPSGWVVAQILFAAVVVAPVVEEVFFRGMLYGALRRRLPAPAAAGVGGVLFGLVHAPAAVVLPMCVFGVMLCYLYERTGRLAVPVLVHGLFNAGQVALMMVYRSL